jgi:hypothetical protein
MRRAAGGRIVDETHAPSYWTLADRGETASAFARGQMTPLRKNRLRLRRRTIDSASLYCLMARCQVEGLLVEFGFRPSPLLAET